MRKVRWTAQGRGKRGGVRVVYDAGMPPFLLTACATLARLSRHVRPIAENPETRPRFLPRFPRLPGFHDFFSSFGTRFAKTYLSVID